MGLSNLLTKVAMTLFVATANMFICSLNLLCLLLIVRTVWLGVLEQVINVKWLGVLEQLFMCRDGENKHRYAFSGWFKNVLSVSSL